MNTAEMLEASGYQPTAETLRTRRERENHESKTPRFLRVLRGSAVSRALTLQTERVP